MKRGTGVHSAEGSSSATATRSRFTAEASQRAAETLRGVLLLTAGCGRRAEPLSFLRPKSLLPWGGGTVLGRLAREAGGLGGRLAANASRCPGLIRAEIEAAAGRACEVFFEPRPLGVVGTLARLGAAGGADGAWLVLNTDMVTDLDFGSMVKEHFGKGASWTAATGDFPPGGAYGALRVSPDGSFGCSSGRPRHYLGASVIGSAVMRMASELRTGTMFVDLAGLASGSGHRLASWESGAAWMDIGTPGAYRRALLSTGSRIDPSAVIEPGATLEGSWFVSAGCSVKAGTLLRDSVMLDGSSLVSGSIVDDVLPWFFERRGRVGDA